MSEATSMQVADNAIRNSNIEDDTVENTKYLTFGIQRNVYAVAIDSVKEIIEYATITRVPMTPKYIHGVINLRGYVVPVVNLAARLVKEDSEPNRRTCIILVELQDGEDEVQVGFVVDAVEEIIDLTEGCIKPPPGFGSDIRADFIKGMGKVGDDNKHFVAILDLDQVLSVPELSELVENESESA